MTSPAFNVMREEGLSRMSYGVGLPSAVRKRKWAIVAVRLGFWSANETSNGLRVLPSAKYQRRDSSGSGGGGGISAVAARLGCKAPVSDERAVTPGLSDATAPAALKMPEPEPKAV